MNQETLPKTHDELLAEGIPLVKHIARSFQISGGNSLLDFDDLVACGTLGLMQSIPKFDSTKGKFSSFVGVRIRGEIIDELRKRDPLSRTARTRLKVITATEEKLNQQLGRMPTSKEIALAAGVQPDQLHQVRTLIGRSATSLEGLTERRAKQTGREAELNVPQVEEEDFTLDIEKVELSHALARAVSALPERDQQVLSLRYEKSLTLRQIGEVLGISETRVCQLHHRATDRLRASLREWDRRPPVQSVPEKVSA